MFYFYLRVKCTLHSIGKKSNLVHYRINPCVYFPLHVSCWPKEGRACLIDHRQWEQNFDAKKLSESIWRVYSISSFYRKGLLSFIWRVYSVIFKPLSYWFEETIGFDVTVSFASHPVSRLIRWDSRRILRKGYSVPRDFSWIENYKLCYYDKFDPFQHLVWRGLATPLEMFCKNRCS